MEKAVFVVPPLVGMFWGAPLIARELDAGTHRLTFVNKGKNKDSKGYLFGLDGFLFTKR